MCKANDNEEIKEGNIIDAHKNSRERQKEEVFGNTDENDEEKQIK